jgi:glycosyltransferase involved in cell wall biosynthesis
VRSTETSGSGRARAIGEGALPVESRQGDAAPRASEAVQPPVSVMIFTLDEEVNLPSCLDAAGWCDDIIVVDSFSRDRTEEIALAHGARFVQHRFTGFGDQRNWALVNAPPKHDWVLILDADERLTPELAAEMSRALRDVPPTVAAFRVRRRFHLWGRWLRYSSLYPNWVVRLVRVGRVRYVNRGHAETQEVDGEIRALDADLIDENLKGLDEWLARQWRYAGAEAEHERELARLAVPLGDVLSRDPMRRRNAIKLLASRMPARPIVYFLYSYIWRGGWRDGRDGLLFCYMKALYQSMIVIRKHDAERRHSADQRRLGS